VSSEYRELIDAIHPAPKPDEKASEEKAEAEEFTQRLFRTKPGHAELIRSIHPDEGE
jgi:hypothetical protein